jgi:hypothetical protein
MQRGLETETGRHAVGKRGLVTLAAYDHGLQIALKHWIALFA